MFQLHNTHASGARAGTLTTAHGELRTPFFMPIATKGAVKTLTAADLSQIEQAVDGNTTPIVLSNTYHQYLTPGLDVLGAAGGLHNFMGWKGAMLTDSGGFQVFSLANLRKLTDDGVEFRSHRDGSKHFFTPEFSMEIQSTIGADIWMAFDYFPGYPATRKDSEYSVQLTSQWAQRCKAWFDNYMSTKENGVHKLFGIVQGSTFDDLREQSATELQEIGFDGYAIGGLAVGEPPEIMYDVLDATVPHLPEDAPRYLMGVGPPEQILESVKRGVDMFDCVLPSRNARHGTVFIHAQDTPQIVDEGLETATYEKLNIRAGALAQSFEPLDAQCTCMTCTGGFTRAYIRHLFTVQEPLASRLCTIHNVHFYMQLMKEIRDILHV